MYRDLECLSDERCHNGICKAVCNSDSKCSPNQICENRLCIGGCRSDTSCPDNEACVDKQCKGNKILQLFVFVKGFINIKEKMFNVIIAPCDSAITCGQCAECKVVNHGVQCSCMPGYNGNPLVGCSKSILKCDGTCPCDLETGYCAKRCTATKDCSCGEICHENTCTTKCIFSTKCPTVINI